MKKLSVRSRASRRLSVFAATLRPLGLCLLGTAFGSTLVADEFPVNFTIPASGQVSAAVYDSNGRLLRSLLHGDQLTAGSYSINWDGLDRHGNPVALGTYSWKMLRTPGFTAQFVGQPGVNPPGNPYDFWIGSHGGVGAVTIDSSNNVYLGSDGTEGVPELAKLDSTGQIAAMWDGLYPSETSEDLEPGNSGHLLDLGSDLYLRVLNNSTGTVLYTVDVLPSGWNREAGKNRALDHDVQLGSGAALSGDSTFVLSYPTGDMLRWYNYQTGALITQVSLTGARGVAVGPSGSTYVISNGAIYKIVYTAGSTTSPVLVISASSLTNPFKIAYDHANDELLVAEGDGSHQVKRFNLSGTLLDTYGDTVGGRAYGDFNTTARNSFRNITDLTADSAGGFWVAEGYFTLRRLSHWNSSGSFLKQHFGGLSYYPGAVMDPDYGNRYYIPIGWDDVALVELDDTTHAWTILKVFKNGNSIEGQVISQLDDLVHSGLQSYSVHWKIQKRNGEKYLVGEHTSGVSILRIDETNDQLVPVAVASKYIPGSFVSKPDEAPAPWDAARTTLGYTLSNVPEFFTWCDLNDNGLAETDEFLFTNSSVKTVGRCFLDDNWNFYFNYYRALTNSAPMVRRMNNTSSDPDHPVWDWSTHTPLSSLELPADFLLGEIGEPNALHIYAESDGTLYETIIARRDEKYGRYGRGFVNDDEGMVRLLKWNASGDLLWELGGHTPDTAFDAAPIPPLPGSFHQPVLILGKINGNLIIQDRLSNPGQVWTDDGLYAGNLLDHRAADGLPDTVYTWFQDASGNSSLLQPDSFVGSINQTSSGDVYWMVNGRQAPVIYKVTGWDGWQTDTGSITVSTAPAASTLTGTGLQGEYFNNNDLSGTPDLTRTDASLWFDDTLSGGLITATWGAATPDAAISTQAYSVRWSGLIEAPLGEDFSLITETEENSKVRLWIDGQLAIEGWQTGVPSVHGGISDNRVRRIATTTFNPGQLYTIRLEYARGTDPAQVHLYWESATMERLHIPAQYLHTTDPTSEIIIDNNDGASLVSTVGSWAPSSSTAGYYGTNYWYAHGAASADRSVTFKPTMQSAGNYAVYFQWPATTNRATNTPVTINHAGGSTTIHVDQTVAGGPWRYLGTYPFEAGKTGTVTITNEANAIVIADAVRFVRDHPAEVNAGEDGFVAWPTDTTTLSGSATDPVGSGSLAYSWSLLTGPVGATATFTSGSTAATDVTVSAAGNYSFLLTVSDGTTSSSDVVDVLFLDEIIVDNNDSGYVTKTGSWGTGISAVYYGTNYFHDGNTGKGTKSVAYAPTLPETHTYTVYAQWSASGNRATSVPIIINHAGGSTTVYVNQQTNGGVWNSLGTYTFNQGNAGTVVIDNTGTSGIVVADAIRLTP